jgi:hypothetical protein
VSASAQPQSRFRSEILKPGSSIAFPLHASPPSLICLDNISYQLDIAPKTRPEALSAAASPASDSSLLAPGKSTGTTGGSALADTLKSEQSRSVDDIKLFFLKGILQPSHQGTTTGTTGKVGTGQPTGSYPRLGAGYDSGSSSGLGSAKVKHNRIYTAAELIQKFGKPSSRTSSATSEQWAYKCKDGVVHVHFTEVGVAYARSSSTSKSDTLRLEVKSVDSSSTPSAGGSRF